MKKFVLTSLAVLSLFPSVAAAAPVLKDDPAPLANTVHFFDNRAQITQRVLDKTIYELIRLAQTIPTTDDHIRRLIDARIKRNIQAVNEHCQRRLRADGNADLTPCGPGFRD